MPHWDMLDSYRPLNVDSHDRFSAARGFMDSYPDRYYIADFTLSGFTVMAFVRGFEDFLADLYVEPDLIEIGLVWTGLQTLGATPEIQKDVLDAWNRHCGERNRCNDV